MNEAIVVKINLGDAFKDETIRKTSKFRDGREKRKNTHHLNIWILKIKMRTKYIICLSTTYNGRYMKYYLIISVYNIIQA